MTRVLTFDGENLIFVDYANRQVKISEENYLELMTSEKRREFRPALEECLSSPSEVWLDREEVDDVVYSYYKYIKVYSNLVFIALALFDDRLNFELNNFYHFDEDEFHLADEERKGHLVLSNLK